MSLISMPFIDTGFDSALHGIAAFVMLGSIGVIALALWKVHELPVHHANTRNHRQLALISALTWIGFLWHWVWVIAIIIAFIDTEAALGRIRDIWREKPGSGTGTSTPSAE